MKNIKKSALILLISFICVLSAAAQGNVSNIRIHQMDNVLIILYDLARRADIELHVSFDGGASFRGPMLQVLGAVGSRINPEVDKVIAWNVMAEIGEIDNSNTILKIVSTDARQNNNRQESIKSFSELSRERNNRIIEESRRNRRN